MAPTATCTVMGPGWPPIKVPSWSSSAPVREEYEVRVSDGSFGSIDVARKSRGAPLRYGISISPLGPPLEKIDLTEQGVVAESVHFDPELS